MQLARILIATAETFSHGDEWVEYEIFSTGENRFVISERTCGIGSGLFCSGEKATERDADAQEVRYLLRMDTEDVGTVTIEDEAEELIDRILYG